MGCDIHPHVEVNINGVWEHYSVPKIPRYYKLFGLLAGVRDKTVTPVALPRGLPSDLSKVTKFAYDLRDGDLHTASWLSSAEMKKAQTEYESWYPREFVEPIFGYMFGSDVFSHLEYESVMDSLKEFGFVDSRVVFWFDC